MTRSCSTSSRAEILQIVDLMIGRIESQLKNKDMGLELTDNSKQFLAKKGYDPVLGARPLRRTIQREIEDSLSEKILFNELRPGQIVVVDCERRPDGHREVDAHLPRSRQAGPGAGRRARRPGQDRRRVTAETRNARLPLTRWRAFRFRWPARPSARFSGPPRAVAAWARGAGGRGG
jgi:hypothetical protein